MMHVTNEWGAREGRCRHGFTCGCEMSCVRTRENGRAFHGGMHLARPAFGWCLHRHKLIT